MGDIVISPNPEQEYHIGIHDDKSGNVAVGKQRYKYAVIQKHPDTGREKVRLRTDYDHELLVSTEKTSSLGLPPIIVTVEHYEKYKKRDGMRIVKQLPIANLRPANWTPKPMITVPDGIYKLESKKENGKSGPGRPIKEK